ncbi:hypothetical protein [Candidatus Vampirococcus lugosii]|uniref:Restriction endonuclease n=1 Tax=Candidatus Vampirococcus lugosii TaxID=2789015 RepID=A0ABS5QMX6_9BACT|nr:hypothetical protein [Candidatus Vampirococcus lugosii]MBS8122078.1 hypothetical protein [Candidatus Vampirococcus lugosii]
MFNFEEKRLDEMEFVEISSRYQTIFSDLIGKNKFEKIEKENYDKYKLLQEYINKGYKFKGGAMGRSPITYGRNMLYGWFLEDLLFYLLSKNLSINLIEGFGDDSKHDFFINDKNQIEIYGSKTTQPDYIIKLNNGKEFLLELKSASKGIFSIKKGNIDQLSKSCAYNGKITLILMIDLLTGSYDLKGLNFFKSNRPFVNQRMEGQLCYDFPVPKNEIKNLINENFNEYLDEDIFNDEFIKKLSLLKIAEDKNNQLYKRIIKQKMRIEKLEEELNYHNESIKQKIQEIKQKHPLTTKSWLDIEKELKDI